MERDKNQPVRDGNLCFSSGFPFGGFQRIHFFGGLSLFFHNVGCQITVAGRPFCCRVGASDAELTSRKFCNPLTTLAAIYNRIALPPIEGAALLTHEGAVPPNFNDFANHFLTSYKKN
jgi:hypothetical protein